MNIYTIKLHNEKNFRYELIRFCESHKISVYLTWMQEDIFNDVLFADLVVNDLYIERFEAKYKLAIISKEKL